MRARGRRLNELLIEKRTLSKYNLATQWFLHWLGMVGFAVASTYDQLEFQLSEYLEFLWEAGQRYNLAGDTLSGVTDHTNAKRKLPNSWRLLGSWRSTKSECVRRI